MDFKIKKNNNEILESLNALGVVFSVTIPKGKFPRDLVEQSLKDNDLGKFSPSLSMRSEFLRAIREMEKNRLVRKVSECKERIIFQFTLEEHAEDREELEYETEAIISFSKNTGDVTCTDSSIQDIIIDKISSHKDTYNEKDIYGIMSRIFDKKCYSLMMKKGIKFVHIDHQEVIEDFEFFLGDIGIDDYVSFVVPDMQSSKNKITRAFFKEMKERKAIIDQEVEEILSKEKISQKALSNRLDRIKENKEMLEMYSDLLEVKVDEYKSDLEDISKKILECLTSPEIVDNDYEIPKVDLRGKEITPARSAFAF